jgi:glycosyltransferase involved in cell wall biosynthesis
MKISVITPVYNGEKYIRRTIESILSQKGDFELEYIVCDGKSTDGTLRILEEYKDRCIIVSRKDGSPQAAINSGMEMATGDIGCWLNADDIFEPGALQAVAETFRKRPACRWLYGRCRIIDENGREIRKPVTLYKNLLGYFYSRATLLCENFINQPSVFWKMDLWRSVDKLSGKYRAAWDYELWMNMADKARPAHVRKMLASFRRHPESISQNNFDKQFSEELEISRKYGNIATYFLHWINARKIVCVYKLLAIFAGRNKKP